MNTVKMDQSGSRPWLNSESIRTYSSAKGGLRWKLVGVYQERISGLRCGFPICDICRGAVVCAVYEMGSNEMGSADEF